MSVNSKGKAQEGLQKEDKCKPLSCISLYSSAASVRQSFLSGSNGKISHTAALGRGQETCKIHDGEESDHLGLFSYHLGVS